MPRTASTDAADCPGGDDHPLVHPLRRSPDLPVPSLRHLHPRRWPALAALLTGNHVLGLRVAPNGSGLTYTSGGNIVAQMLVSSAGYLGSMVFGALLLVLIRRAVAARVVLTGSAIYILALTLLYGFPSVFTIVAGIVLAAALLLVARYAQPLVANFLVAFLAVQCIVGALFDLRRCCSSRHPSAVSTPMPRTWPTLPTCLPSSGR